MAFVINENFEGAGTPSGWFSGGSANFDYTAAPLVGSQSLRTAIATSDYAQAPTLSPNLSEAWGMCAFKTESAMPASFNAIIFLEDSSFGHNVQFILWSNGKLTADGGVTFTTSAMSAGTLYYLWWHFKQGASSNGTFELWFDTSTTRPAVGSSGYNGSTTVTLNWTIDHVKIGSNVNGSCNTANVYDNFQVADTDMFAGAAPSPTTKTVSGFF